MCLKSNKTAVVIQARLGSTRFPSKMLAKLGEYSVLEWVLHRVKKSTLIHDVILAIPDSESNLILESIGKKIGVNVYRGSETNVLARFQGAIRNFEIDNLVRVCADNPFIDPDEIDRLINFYFENNFEYACNHQNKLGSSYADGFGAEIVNSKVLLNLMDDLSLHQREHVTTYIWDNLSEFRVGSLVAPMGLNYPNLRFDIDTPEDLEYLRKLVNLGVNQESTAYEIIRFAKMLP
jgi:spore coat polysaccharide biosynthesis protein SpsF